MTTLRYRVATNIKVLAVYADCPYCGEPLSDPSYLSQMLHLDELDPGATIKCDGCGGTSRLPIKLWR